MKNFFDSELWKWITLVLELALVGGLILLAWNGICAFIQEVVP